MEEKDTTQEEKDTDTEEVAKISPIHPGDRRGHAKRHLLDTCE